jgi:hypothetical protein
MLLCENRAELLATLPARQPSYVHRALSPYDALSEVGEDERADPFHFAPSLARRIGETPHQEIGTHTFSHYYCVEDGQTEAEFRADLEAAAAITHRRFGTTPRSLVFPRNQANPAYLGACRALGVAAYRGAPARWAHRVRRAGDESSLRRAVRLLDRYVAVAPAPGPRFEHGPGRSPVDVRASRYLAPYRPALRALERRRVGRIVGEMRRAADEGRVYHLWWHPEDFGVHLGENLGVLGRVLAAFAALRERAGMESLTMAEAAARLAPDRTPAAGLAAGVG